MAGRTVHVATVFLVNVGSSMKAVVRHLPSGQEFCVVPGTFLHVVFSWGSQFPDDIDASCATKPVLFLVDTNAEPDSLTFEDLCRMQNVSWGTCSDPGVQSDATCCDDISQGILYPQFRSDRIALCRDRAGERGWWRRGGASGTVQA